jgi:hypothetical protein
MHQEQQKANFDVQSSSQDSCDFEQHFAGNEVRGIYIHCTSQVRRPTSRPLASLIGVIR